jgi:hypothetical protein
MTTAAHELGKLTAVAVVRSSASACTGGGEGENGEGATS